MYRTKPFILTSLILVILSACGSTELPVVRQAPAAITESADVTQEALGDAVLAIATVPLTPIYAPIPMTDSGLYIYDNFEYEGPIDRNRWLDDYDNYADRLQYYYAEDGLMKFRYGGPIDVNLWLDDYDNRADGLQYYYAEDGFMKFEFPDQQRASPAYFIATTRQWQIKQDGYVRFAVEGNMMVDPILSRHPDYFSLWIALLIDSGYQFRMGYHSYPTYGLRYDCVLDGPIDDGQVRLRDYDDTIWNRETFWNIWHTFRLEILAWADPNELAVAGYVDGDLICRYESPPQWSEAIRAGQSVSIGIEPIWIGYWSQDEPMVFYFDDIAVMVDEPDW